LNTEKFDRVSHIDQLRSTEILVAYHMINGKYIKYMIRSRHFNCINFCMKYMSTTDRPLAYHGSQNNARYSLSWELGVDPVSLMLDALSKYEGRYE